ncbi:MAG: hypothetical protein LUD27_09270 [Clostridia bacterium]|nr:hypothetical protein [Clostridia bacterium]
MKKKFLALIFAAFAAFSVAAFAACDEEDDEEKTTIVFGTEGSVVSVQAFAFTATESVLSMDESTSVYDYLSALQEAGMITFEGYESSYGYYITSVNGIEEQSEYNSDYTSGSGWSWMIYTSLYELDGVTYATNEYGEFSYGGIGMGQASYGVSYLPCVAGYSYALIYEAWSY